MSLNWKEIDLILEELDLPGMQIQKTVQSTYDVLSFRLYGKSGAKNLLVSLSPNACRLHETFLSTPKRERPLRFAEFLNSRIVNGRIEEASQLGHDRIIRLIVRLGENRFYIYLRLWSNAANVIVTDTEGKILDAMRRLPKKGEVTGGLYSPEPASPKTEREYNIRAFSEELLDSLPPEASFNQKIDAFYRSEGGALSLETLREEARRKFEGSIDRISLSLKKLREKEADFSKADRFREYGDIILSNIGLVKPGAEWIEISTNPRTEGSLDEVSEAAGPAETVRIKLEPRKSLAASAEDYYEQYKKAKSGLAEIRLQISEGEREQYRLKDTLEKLLAETNPLILHKLLNSGGKKQPATKREDQKRPGLTFRRKDWLIIVGRDAAENDALLRKYVKGNDLWLHVRDYPGAYVFIKHRAGKTVPLDILLDAGNLAIFYSKARNSAEGDLFYTPVKYLRRAKNGPKGLVIPTQEKNLHIKVESARLRELEECRVTKSLAGGK